MAKLEKITYSFPGLFTKFILVSNYEAFLFFSQLTIDIILNLKLKRNEKKKLIIFLISLWLIQPVGILYFY